MNFEAAEKAFTEIEWLMTALGGDFLPDKLVRKVIKAAVGDKVLYEKGDVCGKRFVCTWQHAVTHRGSTETVHLIQAYPEVEE